VCDTISVSNDIIPANKQSGNKNTIVRTCR
jgi:hypothetical protein